MLVGDAKVANTVRSSRSIEENDAIVDVVGKEGIARPTADLRGSTVLRPASTSASAFHNRMTVSLQATFDVLFSKN